MAKLVIEVPAQTFEYELSEETFERYKELKTLVKEGMGEAFSLDQFFDMWISDTWPEMEWEVVS